MLGDKQRTHEEEDTPSNPAGCGTHNHKHAHLRLRGGALGHIVAPAVPAMLLGRNRPYIESQEAALCMVHAFNMYCQRSVLTHDLMQSLLKTCECPGSCECQTASAGGWYHSAELGTCLSLLSPEVMWHEGNPHLGRSANMTWATTLSMQQHNMTHCDAVLLTLRPEQHQHDTRTHHVAAIRTGGDSWLLLNSVTPHVVHDLTLQTVARAFDADVCYAVAATSGVPMGRAELVRALTPHVATSTARMAARRSIVVRCGNGWPGASRQCSSSSAPIRLRLFLPREFLQDGGGRKLFNRCVQKDLNVIRYAEKARDGDHIVLVVKDTLHATQVREDMPALQRAVKQLKWHVALDTRLGQAQLSHSLQDAGYSVYIDSHGFELPRRPRAPRANPPPHRPHNPQAYANSFAALAHLSADEALDAPDHDTQLTRAPQTPAPRFYPGKGRKVRRDVQNARYTATWNVHDLGTAEGAARATAIAHYMEGHAIGVLAVQETKIHGNGSALTASGLHYHGTTAEVGRAGTRMKGTGFLVRSEVAGSFDYLGPVAPLIEGYGAVWGRWVGEDLENDVYLASVYMPDATVCAMRGELYDAVLQQVAVGKHKFEHGTNRGHVRLMGDFNARIGNTHSTQMPSDMREITCTHGEDTVSMSGRKLLRFCLEEGLVVASSSNPGSSGPTFMRRRKRGRPNGEVVAGDAQDDVCGSSIVDHVLVPCRLSASLPPAFTASPTDAGIAAVHSDHVPVRVYCPGRQRKQAQRAPRRTSLCAEGVWDSKKCKAYEEKLEARLNGCQLATILEEAELHDQAAVDVASAHVVSSVWEAAVEAFGTRDTAGGCTKRWADRRLTAVLTERRRAYQEWLQAPGTTTGASLFEADVRAKQAARASKKRHKVRAHDAAMRKWQENAGSKGAWRRLKELAVESPAPAVTALYHPTTGQLCNTVDERLDALAAHFQSYAEARTPATNAEAAQHRDSTTAVCGLRRSTQVQEGSVDEKYTASDITAHMSAMPNHKAPGRDGITAELLKRGGDALAEALAHLFNVVHKTECIPISWRQGEMVCLPKDGDLTSTDNYRGLTLLPSINKLFCIMMTDRLSSAVHLNDNQYGFRRGRSTQDALFALQSVVEPRVRAGELTYALFLDWSKAYDRVTHEAMLARLAAKGVRGKAWRLVDALYRSASTRVRLQGSLSDPFPVRCGVAQGCPLSPFLYAVFADALLEDIEAQCAADGVPVGDKVLAAQSYADDSVMLSPTQPGLQRIVNVAKAFGDKWGCKANTKKSVVMLFGTRGAVAEAPPIAVHWGEDALRSVETTKYLGLWLTQDWQWSVHAQKTLAKASCAFHKWVPVLASRRISVAVKRRIVVCNIRPIIEYGMEVWGSSATDTTTFAALNALIDRCNAVSCGVRSMPHLPEWRAQRSVQRHVVRAAMSALPLADTRDLAHARLGARMAVPNCEMRDAAHRSLPPTSPWCKRATSLNEGAAIARAAAAARPHDEARPRKEDAFRVAVWARVNKRVRRELGAAPVGGGVSVAGRMHKRRRDNPAHINPTQHTASHAQQQDALIYNRDSVVYPILALRSSHLPYDFLPTWSCSLHQSAFSDGVCRRCGAHVRVETDMVCTDIEQRWRCVQHMLLQCGRMPRHAPGAVVLLEDLRQALSEHPDSLAVLVADWAIDWADTEAVAARVVPWILRPHDKVAIGVPGKIMSLLQRLASAFVMCVTGAWALEYVSPAMLNSMGVPAWSRLRAYAVQPSRGDEDSDDEVPLYDDQPQLRRLVSDARPQEGVAEADAARLR